MVDGLGWRRVLSNGTKIQPPDARLSRGLEVHPPGRGEEMELWLDTRYVRAGYGWSFPAEDELRVGIGSFWPSHHVKEPTVRLAGDLGLPAEGYQGNWIPHELRTAVEEDVFFAGDSAGHCLPLTAEGIRTALYFGLACGRELRAVLDGQRSREHALRRYSAFSAAHARKFSWLLRVAASRRTNDAQPLAHCRHPHVREPTAVRVGVRPVPRDRAAGFRRRRPARAHSLAPGRRVGLTAACRSLDATGRHQEPLRRPCA